MGLGECVIRVNDRRLLTSALAALGFAPAEFDGVLITMDKLDKIAQEGVIAELRERGFTSAAVDALEAYFVRPTTMEFLPFGEAAIRKFLPEGVDPQAVSAAQSNAERNEVSARFADSAREIKGQFDIVVANILSNPLKALAPAICSHVRPGGQLALCPQGPRRRAGNALGRY